MFTIFNKDVKKELESQKAIFEAEFNSFKETKFRELDLELQEKKFKTYKKIEEGLEDTNNTIKENQSIITQQEKEIELNKKYIKEYKENEKMHDAHWRAITDVKEKTIKHQQEIINRLVEKLPNVALDKLSVNVNTEDYE